MPVTREPVSFNDSYPSYPEGSTLTNVGTGTTLTNTTQDGTPTVVHQSITGTTIYSSAETTSVGSATYRSTSVITDGGTVYTAAVTNGTFYYADSLGTQDGRILTNGLVVTDQHTGSHTVIDYTYASPTEAGEGHLIFVSNTGPGGTSSITVSNTTTDGVDVTHTNSSAHISDYVLL